MQHLYTGFRAAFQVYWLVQPSKEKKAGGLDMHIEIRPLGIRRALKEQNNAFSTLLPSFIHVQKRLVLTHAFPLFFNAGLPRLQSGRY